VCTFKCRFCGFSKGPLSLDLRGAPYLLTLDDIAQRASEAWELGATEVTLQGGIHPSFDGDYYIDVVRAVKDAVPGMHVHGFTALEVIEGARRVGEDLPVYLGRLKDAGLASLPGTAAEILDDEVRAVLCPDKITTDEWLDCHAAAHDIGLRSNVTIMFGSIEHPESWARHLLRTRALQKTTGGFTEFVGLPFVHMATPIYLQRASRRGPTFRETLLMHSVARLVYRGQHPAVLGEGRPGRRAADVAGWLQRPRRHAHRREHLPRRWCHPRAGDDRDGFHRPGGTSRPPPATARHPLRTDRYGSTGRWRLNQTGQWTRTGPVLTGEGRQPLRNLLGDFGIDAAGDGQLGPLIHCGQGPVDHLFYYYRFQSGSLSEPGQVLAGDVFTFSCHVEVVLARACVEVGGSRAHRVSEIVSRREPPAARGRPQVRDVAAVVIAVVSNDI